MTRRTIVQVRGRRVPARGRTAGGGLAAYRVEWDGTPFNVGYAIDVLHAA
jgi:hypothetical protein